MSRAIQILHGIQATGGILFGFYIAYVAYQNYVDGRPDLTPGRIMLSVFLLAYSASQLFIVAKTHATILKLLSFPVLYVVFGFAWEYSSRGYIKGWAPATHEEAVRQNIIYFIVLSFIVALAMFVTFKESRNTNGTHKYGNRTVNRRFRNPVNAGRPLVLLHAPEPCIQSRDGAEAIEESWLFKR